MHVKINSRVTTPHGSGTVVKKETFRQFIRWGVKLDVPQPGIPLDVHYYFDHEVFTIKPEAK